MTYYYVYLLFIKIKKGVIMEKFNFLIPVFIALFIGFTVDYIDSHEFELNINNENNFNSIEFKITIKKKTI